MGYIVVRPRDPKDVHGFRGFVWPYPWADQVIEIYEQLGGPEKALIEIVRRKDEPKVSIQVYEPPHGEGGYPAPSQELP